MQITVVERAVTLDRCAVLFILNGVDVGVKVDAALVVVAACINDRIGVDKVVLHLTLEPEAELLSLCTGALDQIAAVQDDIWVIVLDRGIQLFAGRENVRVGQRDQANLFGIVAQRAEAGLAALAAFQLDLIIILGAGGQVVQLVMEQVHLGTVEIGCVSIRGDRDRLTQIVCIGTIGNGRADGLCALPDHDHTIGLWRQQIGTVLEGGTFGSEGNRCHGCQQYGGQHQ